MPNIVYKILAAVDWESAKSTGAYHGSADDQRDGYIHLSDGDQLDATAAKYFSHQSGLLLVAFDAGQLGAALRWEPSRGGALFPHYYGALDPRLASWAEPMTVGADGVPRCVRGDG